MAPMRAPRVERAPPFHEDLAALREKYSTINDVVDDLSETLTAVWRPPHTPVDPSSLPEIFAVNLDYPPSGAEGRGIFRITYHATPEVANKMSDPLRTYTLLTIQERQPSGEQ
jgi:hypothetical protein